MKTRLLIAAMAVAVLVVSTSMNAGEKKEKKEKLAGIKCPVSGKAVVGEKTVAYKGAKVYFCCANCPKAFEKDTKKFATKANYQLFATKQAKATKCAVKGKPLNKRMTVEVAGSKVAFCCAGCKGKVAKADDDKQLELVFGEKAFQKGFEVIKKKTDKKKDA